MEKTIRVNSIKDKDISETLYWHDRSATERFEVLELLHQRFYGCDEASQRF